MIGVKKLQDFSKAMIGPVLYLPVIGLLIALLSMTTNKIWLAEDSSLYLLGKYVSSMLWAVMNNLGFFFCLGLAGGLAFAAVLLIPGLMIGDVMYSARWAYVLPLVPLILGAGGAVPRNRWPFVLFFLGIYGGAFGILLVRTSGNLAASGPEGLIDVMWIVGTVVISDVLGYFAGRSLGGPKFWPAISPKKTWSGTVAGWIGAFLFALVIVLVTGGHDWWMLAAGPLIAFAGQMGDIAESWLKRRVGVKDSSNLIPGHGGVMDRFDAMTGAFVLPALAVGVTMLIFVLTYPLVGG